jgi:lipopolysaccharide/colanic/teichoic acid biosynthesis glycosyltransferase
VQERQRRHATARLHRITPLAFPDAASGRDAAPPRLLGELPWTTGQRLYVLALKRLLDAWLTLLLLVLCLPVMGGIALALRLSARGPILYRQQRIGQHGVPFTVYKFRTMTSDRRTNEQRVHFPDRRQRHKSETDPRVTRIGRVLRRTSLDELPQLLNVLRGEMSLIGPRPELPQIVARYAPWQHERHLVRPGITGWWQVNGRSGLPMHEHTDLDIAYVRRISPQLDLLILLKTAKAVVSRHGAF